MARSVRVSVAWSGSPGPDPLTRALRAAGLVVRDGRPAELLLAWAARPGPRHPGPWVWLFPGPHPPPPRQIAQALESGALDVIAADSPDAAARIVERAEELAAPAAMPTVPADVVAESPAMRRVLAELQRAARTSMAVLLTGETGTGKEVTARLLHKWSARASRRFVPINCAAIPKELLESELFGYARGAFSGATQSYEGELAGAEGGTVFLDEIDDTPASFQTKLLRVLEDKVVNRLGENSSRKVDFRIVAATNRDLRELIAEGSFGPDLYERLAIVSIHLPPLRDRQGDLPAMAHHMVGRFYREEPGAREVVAEVTPEALAVLAAHSWPGNVRELRNVIFAALVHKRHGTRLLPSDLPRALFERRPTGRPAGLFDRAALSDALAEGGFSLRDSLAELERAALELALERSDGNAAAAARLLGEVGRGKARDPGATVRAMMRRLGLPR